MTSCECETMSSFQQQRIHARISDQLLLHCATFIRAHSVWEGEALQSGRKKISLKWIICVFWPFERGNKHGISHVVDSRWHVTYTLCVEFVTPFQNKRGIWLSQKIYTIYKKLWLEADKILGSQKSFSSSGFRWAPWKVHVQYTTEPKVSIHENCFLSSESFK